MKKECVFLPAQPVLHRAEKPSHVISALGIPKEKAYGTIRITIGHENTRKEIDYTVEKLKAGVKELRAKS